VIKNEKQYKISKSWLRKFEEARQKLDELPKKKEQLWLKQAQKGSLEAQIWQLREEITEYEALKAGKIIVPSLDVLSSVPELLIKKRIANNWTLEQLAERLGMHHQQIQRYESTDYATATFETLKKVAVALNQETVPANRKISNRAARKTKRA
jgi:ribosome-binding protein aMBF1 (putative translation factor)